MTTQESRRHWTLMIGALGVVYGDIGTSPLYALRECFSGPHSVAPTPNNVFGVVSLIVWSLVLIVSIKYLAFVMRADHQGEGGILALLPLAVGDEKPGPNKRRNILLGLGVFGAALLYGDGMLTPAVTVLSAVEGLEVLTLKFRPFVVPIAVVVLVLLFWAQRFGTGKVGAVFGPVMVVWFLSLAALGLRGILLEPKIFGVLSPHHGIHFLLSHGRQAFVVLGSVFLAVTGAEALYADMGHFGARPIRVAWFWIVFPGLLLNYLGEGALLLRNPEAAQNPFFFLAPAWAVLPLVGLATAAAIIASQALISGAYSLTMQAIQMGYLPRLRIQHTSQSERGQIYMPQINGLLMVACLSLVVGFKTSSGLAGAYGIAVSLTMLTTTVLFFEASRRLWGWTVSKAAAMCAVFLVVELAFAFANGMKLLQGGWFPLVVGLMIFTVMTTWNRGRQLLRARLADSYLPFDTFLKQLDGWPVHRVPGTSVFLSGNRHGTPIALLHNLRHNKVLHEKVVVLTILTQQSPYVPPAQRFEVEKIREDIYRVIGYYGFMEQPDVPALLTACAAKGLLSFEEMKTTFFLSRETVVHHSKGGMTQWRRRLFSAMSRNAQPATAFYQLPPNRVVELGMQVEL